MANGKEGFGELRLTQLAQEVALVFVSIRTRQEVVHAVLGGGFLCVVPGSHKVSAQLQGRRKEEVKFDFSVAEDIGIGGSARLVFRKHVVDNAGLIVGTEI